MNTRGLPEVPMKLDPGDPMLKRLLVEMRESIVQLRASQAPLQPPTNFRGTALAFAVLLEWTRVVNADYYDILWSVKPDLKQATVQGVGDSQRWIDNVGQAAVTRSYWVRARKFSGARSREAGPVTVTTLAAATGVNPVAPPPPGHVVVIDRSTGHQVYYLPVTGGRYL